MINIVILSFMTGLLAGSALTYSSIKSYRAAIVSLVGALMNLGLLVFVLLLEKS